MSSSRAELSTTLNDATNAELTELSEHKSRWLPGSDVAVALEAETDPTLRNARRELALTAVSVHLVALQHLSGLAAMLAIDGMLYPCATAARVTLETDALCYYLLDPNITGVEAFRRYANTYLISGMEQLRIAHRDDDGHRRAATIEQLETNAATLLHTATTYGLTAHPSPQDLRTPATVGKGQPSSTNLVKDLPSGERLLRNIYSILSGVAHGKMFALSQFITNAAPATDTEFATADIAISPEREALMYATTVIAHHDSSHRLRTAFGWAASNTHPENAMKTCMRTWATIAGVPTDLP
ncbi:hypothetical protein [Rudaeicoccus suwonensis]|uniref:Uncharacterized protein n=1 Tax=Rudaeicoccus suwonensis TaxID=657409 RepID=A0A561DVL3_9MICO|nr:hypothetical protein [Rudaeicoccus suwonensis]TWE07384.1 hypothetical protein BKA23_3397 [Rudaeicoccus suwonensis]